MASAAWSRHNVETADDRVVKRFAAQNAGRAAREWQALTLLSAHAPGLGPEPHEADLTADEPVIVMSRLPGVPLRGTAMDAAQLRAFAAAVTRLHAAVPAEAVRETPTRSGRPAELVKLLGTWAVDVLPKTGGRIREALDAGLTWLPGARLGPDAFGSVAEVFGPGDGNLANYLWDGAVVRIVDFEESGRSDRAFELAEITEHVGGWVDTEHSLDVPAFLAHFTLSDAETARLGECRRLLALVWLFMLAMDGGEHPRNPPGTADCQAERLMHLLC
ncbi:phosphotransferase family protein [Yinghuangia soli]|uniref:Aminoglycoside phosphotransferase family protein n=1 Tax=Yinghuangia soli TaxID=2908204 RepID=A0AA41QA48_9ACTN|nr:phosphotransferase [Yinghuangia soli]MCF2533007.1 aminoglycoside phosphotransferase family protein [Yinghuangia soli]